jgi:hypothetical protein
VAVFWGIFLGKEWSKVLEEASRYWTGRLDKIASLCDFVTDRIALISYNESTNQSDPIQIGDIK